MKQPSKFNSSNLLERIIKWGLIACLFMPLIIGSSFVFPFIFPKQTFFQIIVEILLGLYFILALKEPQFRPRFSKLFWALVAYLSIIILSSVFGVNTYHSFWSNYERMAGVFSLWHYFAFLFIAFNVFKAKEDWHRFFNFSIIASVLEALYGLGQLIGIQAWLHGSGARIDGTIGNASFLAGYMLINALFAFWLALEKKNIGWRIFYIIAIILDVFILYESETRGAILALTASIFVLAIFFIFASGESLSYLPLKNPGRLKKYVMGVLILFALTIGIIWLGRNSNFVKNQPTLRRLTSISFQETTSKTRLMAWQMTLKGFLDRPIFGWGLENYVVVFNKYYNPHLYPVESWFDRSHNAYLDVLINTGIVGLAAYLSIFVLAFWYLWRSWKQRKINYQTFAIFAVILLAYGIQNITLFDTQVTLLMIFAILAFVTYLSADFLPTQQKKGKPLRPNIISFSIVALSAILLIYFLNIKPAMVSLRGIDSLILLQQNQIPQAIEKYKQVSAMGTFGLPEVTLQFEEITMRLLGSPQVTDANKKLLITTAVDGMKKSLQQLSSDVRYMLMLGNFYLYASQTDPSFINEADSILQKAQELSPTRQELLFSIAQLRMFQGRTAEALTLLKQAVDLNDVAPQPHWNYGLLLIALNEKNLGEIEIQKAKDRGFNYDANAIKQLINVYMQTRDRQRIMALYTEWMQKDPTNPTVYTNLADTFYVLGEKENARDYALKAAQLDSSLKTQVDQFIKALGF